MLKAALYAAGTAGVIGIKLRQDFEMKFVEQIMHNDLDNDGVVDLNSAEGESLRQQLQKELQSYAKKDGKLTRADIEQAIGLKLDGNLFLSPEEIAEEQPEKEKRAYFEFGLFKNSFKFGT